MDKLLKTKPKINIQTLGCKVNQQESQLLQNWFNTNGYEVVTGNVSADAYIINTCTVTSMADSKSRQKIRKAKAINPDAIVAAIGCYPQVSASELSSLDEIDILIGSEEKDNSAIIVAEALKEKGVLPQISEEERIILHINKQDESLRTRAYIKIEDGCDRFCSYCIIPYARGAVRSRSTHEILEETKEFLTLGYKEIIITGINIALYGRDLVPKTSLYELLLELSSIDGKFRIRLGSLEPNVVDIETVRNIASLPKLCHHWHLSLQSGSDKIIKDMNRNYSSEDFLQMVSALREIDPFFSITTDIIVGFPGETGEDFSKSIEIVKAVRFAKVHVFKYSKRKNTVAFSMENQIPEQVKSLRSKELIDISEKMSRAFLEDCTDSKQEILIFGLDKSKTYYRGITDNGIEVNIPISDEYSYKENEFIFLNKNINATYSE